jgi:hypothetical protein
MRQQHCDAFSAAETKDRYNSTHKLAQELLRNELSHILGNFTERFESSAAILSVVEILIYYFSTSQPVEYRHLQGRTATELPQICEREFEILSLCSAPSNLRSLEVIVSGSELVSSLWAINPVTNIVKRGNIGKHLNVSNNETISMIETDQRSQGKLISITANWRPDDNSPCYERQYTTVLFR